MARAMTMTAARDAISVFKPRIALAIMLSAIGGVAVSRGPAELSLTQTALLALAVFLAAGAAGAFNQWAEADLDRSMKRTRSRPFVTGRFANRGGWLAIIAITLTAGVVLAGVATNWWAALHTFLGAFTYGVIYTLWLKRRTWANIIIGGLAGSFAVLAGAAAVNPAIGPVGWLLAVVLFLWTPPHFWSLAMVGRDDYAAAGVPMLPVVAGDRVCAWVILAHTVALVALSLAPLWFGLGVVYGAGAALGGGLFAWTSVRLVARPDRRRALVNFFASLAQLVLMLGGAVAERLIAAV